jgi:hypothetical protein
VNRNSLGTILLLLVTASMAFAEVEVVVEPDDYPAGTEISHLFPGVTLSTVNSDLGDPSVFALVPPKPYWASTGELVFGHAGNYPAHWVMDTVSPFRYGALRADFLPPVQSVTLDFIGNDASDYGQLTAYDAGGTLLASLQTGLLTSGEVEALTVANLGDISYIIAGGLLADTVCLDHMIIPEPAAALLLLGAAALVGRRRT